MLSAQARKAKPHNIRVAIIETGINNRQIIQNFSIGDKSGYYQSSRFGRSFAASLKHQTNPSTVVDKILEPVSNEPGYYGISLGLMRASS